MIFTEWMASGREGTQASIPAHTESLFGDSANAIQDVAVLPNPWD